MNKHVILRVVSSIAIPFIFMFGWYVLFHGKVSPGGGFQGGAICAMAFILHAMIFGSDKTLKIVPLLFLRALASLGALIFIGFGFASIFYGGKFLEYNAYPADEHLAHFIGVMGVETGIQITVFAVLTAIFLVLDGEKKSS